MLMPLMPIDAPLSSSAQPTSFELFRANLGGLIKFPPRPQVTPGSEAARFGSFSWKPFLERINTTRTTVAGG